MPAGADHATQVIAQQVYRLRKSREWTAQRLADEMTKAGIKWDRQVVAKLENNRRQSVTVAELYALGQVFAVPPTLLLFPVGRQDTVEVLPGRQVDTWTAARWFAGEQPRNNAGAELAGDIDAWDVASAPLRLRRKHDELLDDYDYERMSILMFEPESDDPTRTRQKARAEVLLRQVRGLRAEMRRHGYTPPKLDEDLEHIDAVGFVYLTPEQADEYAREHPGDLRFAEWATLRRRREDGQPTDAS